jgi:hypothetical protein
MNLELLEKELKKRVEFEYVWGRKQTNSFDKRTNFIYKTASFELLLNQIETNFKSEQTYTDLKNYALNRWFNFWSAKGVEAIFCEHENVQPHPNSTNKFTDFYISTIPFDHKTTVFPKGFQKSIPYAIEHKRELIEWLYNNQSKEQRQHFKNRLFIVLINGENYKEHWKLKAEISWLKQVILSYLSNFNTSKLATLTIENSEIKADVIWAIK